MGRTPPGAATIFDNAPELFAGFNRFYGTLWTNGQLDQATKEVGRLRNARVTGCAICRNLRFDGAIDAGLSEDHVDHIDDGYESSDLPERWKVALRWSDAIIGHPASQAPAERPEVEATFSREEAVELTLTVAIAQGFSKAAVAWGPPPEIPLMVIPTPNPESDVTQGTVPAS
jgi:alkylhydroperoxidase family enzyme